MRVFLCWSGEASQHVARTLYGWLRDVIQDLRPFMSAESISKGERWRDEVGESLSETNFGVLCLTKSNLKAPWILFEAGALSKDIKAGRVTALLIGIEPTDVVEPLSQFQQTRAAKSDIFSLVKNLNSLFPPDRQLEPDRLARAFDRSWPELEQALVDAMRLETSGKPVVPKRDIADIVTETLELVRGLTRDESARRAADQAAADEMRREVHRRETELRHLQEVLLVEREKARYEATLVRERVASRNERLKALLQSEYFIAKVGSDGVAELTNELLALDNDDGQRKTTRKRSSQAGGSEA